MANPGGIRGLGGGAYQDAATGQQVGGGIGEEPAQRAMVVAARPGAVGHVPRRAVVERRIEGDQLEPCAGQRPEQVALQDAHPPFQSVDHRVDLGAAHGCGVEVHRGDDRPASGQRQGDRTAAGSDIQRPCSGRERQALELVEEEGRGEEELRVEDAGEHHQPEVADPRHVQPAMAAGVQQGEASAKGAAGKPGGQARAPRPWSAGCRSRCRPRPEHQKPSSCGCRGLTAARAARSSSGER